MMETPQGENLLLLNFNLKHNNINFNISLFDNDNNEIKVLSREKDDNKKEIKRNYETILKFNELDKTYKYFRMFDNYEEKKNNFIELCKRKNVKINYCDEKLLIIIMDFITIKNNLMNITLNRIEISDKEQNYLLLKDLNYKNEQIDELNIKIKEIKKELELKDNKIKNLEQNLSELNIRITNLEKNNQINNNNNSKLKSIKSESNDYIYKSIIEKSSILADIEEIKFLFNIISQNNNLNLELLYSSELYGENEEKLKSSYIGVNDIIIMVKTKKNKRFGGYVHESFEDNEFKKSDNKAFLFNLDKKKIYKSKGNAHSLWNYSFNSIDFGAGTDLRIFHKFFTNKNYTNPVDSDFEYNNESFALNGEKYFQISILEIYKVN